MDWMVIVLAVLGGGIGKALMDWAVAHWLRKEDLPEKLRNELRSDNEALRREVARLQASNDLLTKENAALRAENMELKGELGSVSGRLTVMEAIVQSLIVVSDKTKEAPGGPAAYLPG